MPLFLASKTDETFSFGHVYTMNSRLIMFLRRVSRMTLVLWPFIRFQRHRGGTQLSSFQRVVLQRVTPNYAMR